MVPLTDQLELDSDLTDYINKYASMMDMQANPIALFNESTTLLYTNPALHNILKTKESLPTLEQFNDLFRGLGQVINSSISENKAKTFNKVVKDTATDQLIPYKIKIIPVTHKEKCHGAFIIVETDVKRLIDYFMDEKSTLSNKISDLSIKLASTFNFVNALFDNSPVGMMILDMHHKILQINKSGADILNVKPVTAVGVPISRFYLEKDGQSLVDESLPEEVHAVTWTGKKKVLMRCSVDNKGEDQDTFIVETFVDVTAIEKARIAAEKSNKVKSEFLANMSHELRTPLHAILGFSQCGIEQANDLSAEKALSFYQKIYHGGEVLLALVDDLLDIAKLESGKIKFKYKLVQFDELVKQVINEFDTIADAHAKKIKVEVEHKIKSIEMDNMRMQQVVRNLISNAVKFTAKKSEITLLISQTDDFIQLKIRDHGPGIPERELENIFEKFTQSTATNTGAGGTGLGLAISREILKHHNGVIWAENNPEGGATFVMKLYFNKKIDKLQST